MLLPTEGDSRTLFSTVGLVGDGEGLGGYDERLPRFCGALFLDLNPLARINLRKYQDVILTRVQFDFHESQDGGWWHVEDVGISV